MKVIIGAGCVGLSIAYKLLEKYKSAEDIIIIDKYNVHAWDLINSLFINIKDLNK